MANRLSAIATRTGDDGTTGLGDGSRTPKDDIRVQSMGDVDELNSMIGLLLTESVPDPVREDLISIQHDLFDLGGELCIPGYENVDEVQLARLDENLARYNADLPRLAEFILPGGSRAAAIAHLCRTICRRAERSVVALARDGAARPICQKYLNRLSDLMFVLSRVLNRTDGGSDVLWQQGRNKPVAD
ncbi:MAG: cob(I)yrinic acid a,c-diamide adenosyltransferase [Burkholderiaceae bacterium]